MCIWYFLIFFLYLLKLYLKFEASDTKYSFWVFPPPFATNNTRLLRKVTLSMKKMAFEIVQPYWCKYVFVSFGYFSQVVVTKWLTNSYIMPFNSTLIYFICNDKFILHVFWMRPTQLLGSASSAKLNFSSSYPRGFIFYNKWVVLLH